MKRPFVLNILKKTFLDRLPDCLKNVCICVSSLTLHAGKIVRLRSCWSQNKSEIKPSVRIVVHVEKLSEAVNDRACAVFRFRSGPRLSPNQGIVRFLIKVEARQRKNSAA